MVFVDALRVMVIVIVIAHHAAQPYGPTGGAWPVTDPGNIAWLGPFFMVNAAFGMGLLFLLAGYFVPGSYDRKGPRRFLRDRWTRIGVPLVAFASLVHVPVAYFTASGASTPDALLRSLYRGGWQNVYGHLWFLGHLLLYSGAYVAWRWAAERRGAGPRESSPPPGHVALSAFVAGLALLTWVVRGWYAIDEWVPLLFVVAAEPAHLPQYAGLFLLGAVAYRGDWLSRLPTKLGTIWLSIGLAASIGIFAARLLFPDRWADAIAVGGFNGPSLLYSTWEALVCVGLCVGLTVLAREVFRRANPLLAAMSAASYAAYIVHLLLVVSLQFAVVGLDLPPLVKFGLVTAFGVLLSFGVGHLSQWIPGARVVLGTSPGASRSLRSS
jgi:surface polysaccharide O-acyltransferase-like enzyme